MGDFDEAKHPRDQAGKFSDGAGSLTGDKISDHAVTGRKFDPQRPGSGFYEQRDNTERQVAFNAKKAEAVHAARAEKQAKEDKANKIAARTDYLRANPLPFVPNRTPEQYKAAMKEHFKGMK